MPLSFPLFVIALNRKSEEVYTRCNIHIFTEENITGAKRKRALGEDVRENQNERTCVGGCVGARKKGRKCDVAELNGGVFRKYLRGRGTTESLSSSNTRDRLVRWLNYKLVWRIDPYESVENFAFSSNEI